MRMTAASDGRAQCDADFHCLLQFAESNEAAVRDGGLVGHVYCGASANTQSDPPAGTEASRGSPENSE